MRDWVRIRGVVPGVLLLLTLIVLLTASLTGTAAADTVGTVARLQGEAYARSETESQRRPLAVGGSVETGDVLSTGPGARLEVALSDGGTLQLGENAAFVIDTLALGDGGGGLFSTVMRLFSGPFRLLGDHAGGQVRTAAATIGIRGTDVWGGFIDGGFGVLLAEGVVDVITPGGVARLDQPGEGVMVLDPAAGPQDQQVWAQGKVDRAIATVAFSE